MAVPKQILRMMHLEAGSRVDLNVENGKMVVAPKIKPHYTLAELLAQCSENNMAPTQDDHEWLNAKPAGKEAL